MTSPQIAHLASGIKKLKLEVPPAAQEKMLAFLTLLQKWNKTFNLTAIPNQQMLVQHLLDSLSIAPYLTAAHIIDIGSGAGLPGIPLALAFPQKQFVLLDSVGKKTAFLHQAKATFKIDNVTVVQSRVEQYQPTQCFDGVVCRAFGTVDDIVEKTQHLICEHGHWLIMKGENPKDELANVHLPYKVDRLIVPGLHAERHLVTIENCKEHRCE
jgi:16S rRNA (guanine527-N7)-methyltransferase